MLKAELWHHATASAAFAAGQGEIGMRKALVALLLGSVCVLGLGCKDEAPASGSAPTATAAAADPNSTGVAECDAYLKQMLACYAGTPQEASIKQSTTALREKLKGDAANDKEKAKKECMEHSSLLEKNPACAKK
jgi:hypothetical protein